MLGKRKILNDAEISRWTPAMQFILDHLAKRKNERTKDLQALIGEYIRYDQDMLKLMKHMEQEGKIAGEKNEYGWVWRLVEPEE
jgi:hypothetical protein